MPNLDVLYLFNRNLFWWKNLGAPTSLYVSRTCFPVWPLLGSVLFVELLHLYLIVTIAKVVDCLNHIFFLLCVKETLFFHAWTDVHILQFSSGTIPLNFAQLSRNGLSFFLKLQISLFLFISIPFIHCAWRVDCLFFWVELSHFFCVNVTQLFCVSPFSVCECHTNMWALH